MAAPTYMVCPVCGFCGDGFVGEDFEICPCCGTQFGYDDATRPHFDLRRIWMSDGCVWWSNARPPPLGWDPQDQIKSVM